MKVEEDRKERRRKLGLPEELTEEEKEKEEKRRQKKLKEEADRLEKHVAYAKPVGIIEKLRKILVGMKREAGGMNWLCLSFSSACVRGRCFQIRVLCSAEVHWKHRQESRRREISANSVEQRSFSAEGGLCDRRYRFSGGVRLCLRRQSRVPCYDTRCRQSRNARCGRNCSG